MPATLFRKSPLVSVCSRAALVLIPATLLLVSGCSGPSVFRSATTSPVMEGKVFGGQQPVSGSLIQLYAVGTSGDGSASTSLVSSTVLTNSGGGFSITGLYTCPSAVSQVYLTATGGNPGLAGGTNNPDLALMVALGRCGDLSASTNLTVDEVTTAAATSALAPFANGVASVGSASSDASGLASAFTLANIYANSVTGTAPGSSVPTGYAVPVAQVNTVADLIAVCVNSAGGTAGDSSACGQLLALTRPSSAVAAPANTVDALFNLAKNPTLNTAALFNLIMPNAPFQPTQPSTPPDLSIGLTITATTLSFSPSSLSFAAITATYATVPLTTTLSNTGSNAAAIGALSFGGTYPGDFTQINDCPAILAPGASCSVQVTATPAAQGVRSGTLVATAPNLSGGSVSASLSDGGTSSNAGVAMVSPASLNFTTAGALTDLTLIYTGSTPLHFKSVVSSDPSFTVAANTCSAGLPTQGTCVITVQSNGAYSNGGTDQQYYGTLTVTDDSSTGSQTVALFSSGALTVDAPVFPATAVGNTSASVQGSVTGTSHSDAANFMYALSGANPGDFAPSPAGCNATSLGPPRWQLCSYTMTFSPTAAGPRSARIYRNVSNTTEYFPLTGYGVGPGSTLFTAPALALSGTSSTVSTPALSRNITVQNQGATSITFASFPFYGTDVRGFSATSNCTSIAPGASCTVTVRYSNPSAQAGTVSAGLVLTDTGSGVSQTSAVSVVLAAPSPVVTPSSYTFPAQPVGTPATKTFLVTDSMGNPLGAVINLSVTSGSPYTVSPASCPASTTAVCTVTVTFTPTSTATASSTLTASNGGAYYTNASVPLSGTGSYNGAPALTLGATAVQFGTSPQYVTTAYQNVSVTNTGTGNAPLTISSITLGGSYPSSFRETNNCPASLAQGASCMISVAFAPTVIGAQSATVTIVSNAASSPDVLTLSGTGS